MKANTNNCNSAYKIEDIQGIIQALHDNSVTDKIDGLCKSLRSLAEYIENNKSTVSPYKLLVGVGGIMDGLQEDVREAAVIAGANDAVQRATDMLAVMNRKETPNIRMEG